MDPLGLWIPERVRQNVTLAAKVATNNAFSNREINALLEIGEEKATFSRLWAFREICFGVTKTGEYVDVKLTNKQIEIFEEVLKELLIENKESELLKKAHEEYLKAREAGRLKVIDKPCP